MGRIDVLDKEVDWVAVTKEYLNELYSTIARLKADADEDQKEIDWLRHELEDHEDRLTLLPYAALVAPRLFSTA